MLKVTWISHNRKAKCPPDPDWPNGKPADVANGLTPSCKIDLPYPAPECGIHHIECVICGWSVGITAAGRPDDAPWAKLPCRISATRQ